MMSPIQKVRRCRAKRPPHTTKCEEADEIVSETVDPIDLAHAGAFTPFNKLASPPTLPTAPDAETESDARVEGSWGLAGAVVSFLTTPAPTPESPRIDQAWYLSDGHSIPDPETLPDLSRKKIS